MQLQACTKCGAQFDVSGFQPGQSFSCGACGAVLVAGGRVAGGGEAAMAGSASSRKPGTARKAAAGAAPAASATRAPAGRAPRGPAGKSPGRGGRQYVPVDRDGGAKSPKAARPSRSGRSSREAAPAREERAARGSRGEKKGGVNPVVVGSILGAVVLGVLGLVLFGSGGDKKTDGANGTSASSGSGGSGGTNASGGGSGTGNGTGSGGGNAAPTVAPPTYTAAEVMGEYGTNPPTTKKQWLAVVDKLEALGADQAAQNALGVVYRAYVATIDGRADPKAHRFLGHREFVLTGDDESTYNDIARSDLEFMRGVKAAKDKRWFTSEEEEDWQLAQSALKEMREYMHRLETDREFRAGIAIRGNLANQEFFKEYNFVGHWASPWLICYSSNDRLSEYDLLSIEDASERKARREELAAKRAQYERLVAEKGHMVQQLYGQWMKVFGEALELKPLMDEYGGRPDYPIGVRSFGDGCPMVMWVFDNRASWDEFHQKVKKELIPHFAAGYFSGESEMVMLYDEGEGTADRVFEIGKTVHEGVHQLEHFFSRQKNNWRKPPFSQDFLGEGIAEWLGSVKMNDKYELEFIGINVTRLGEAQGMNKMLEAGGKEYKFFPLEFMTSCRSYSEPQQYAVTEWGLDTNFGMSMYYQQSWGFVYFLNTYQNGKYWPKFLKFVDLMMQRPKGDNSVSPYFKQAFDITGEEDWEDLDDEFQPFMKSLLDMDLKPYRYTPPPRKR
ncbi:MAG: hypothetical protein H6806_09690 [Planctomycetes bacterium]|nr:hypothetical protein [Planctomycetota bacterium]MCB9825733.1 hypothetical protein [Planctomycetota bacterium]MCB9830017.1 hypothetical protein [Planctomycetota bacterium]